LVKHGIDPELAQKADQATLERVLITKGTKYTIGDCMRLRELLQRTPEIEVCPLAMMEQKNGGAVSSSWSHRWLRVVQVQRGDRVVLELQTFVGEHGELQNSREILTGQDRVRGIGDDRGKGKREHRFDMSVATTAEDAGSGRGQAADAAVTLALTPNTTLSLSAQSEAAKKDWLRRLEPFCLLSPAGRSPSMVFSFVSGGVDAESMMRCQTDEEKKKLTSNALKHVKCVFDLVDENCDEVLNESEFREALKRLAPKHQRTLDNQALLQKIKMADTDGDELLNFNELLQVINDDPYICTEIEEQLKGKPPASIIDADEVMEKIKSKLYQPTFYVSIKIFSIREIDDKHHTFHANFKINIDWEDKDELPYELGQGPSCKCWPKLKVLNQIDASSMPCAPDKEARKKEKDGKWWWCLEKEFDGVFKSENWHLVRVCRRAQPRCCAVSRMLAAYPPAPSPCVWIGAQPRTNFRSTTRNWRCR
jgi:hypothetical protein